MQKPPMPDWSDLPESLRADPALNHFRLTHVETRLDHHETLLTNLQDEMNAPVESLLKRIPLPVLIAILGVIATLRPQLLSDIATIVGRAGH